MWLSYCSFHDYGDTVLFYIDSEEIAYLLRLVWCYLNGSCPLTVTSAMEFDTALLVENTIITLSPGVINTRNCHLLYLLTHTYAFTSSDQLTRSNTHVDTTKFTASSDIAKTDSFTGTVLFSSTVSFSRTDSFFTKTDDVKFAVTGTLTKSSALRSTVELPESSLLTESLSQSMTENFTASETVTKSAAVFRSTDRLTISSAFPKTNVLSLSSEHSLTAKLSVTKTLQISSRLSSSQRGFDKTLHFSATDPLPSVNNLASTFMEVIPPTDLPEAIPSTVQPISTVIIASGQSYPPTISPLKTVPPVSTFLPKTAYYASTFPPISTDIVLSGQTYPETRSPPQTEFPEATISQLIVAGIASSSHFDRPAPLTRITADMSSSETRAEVKEPVSDMGKQEDSEGSSSITLLIVTIILMVIVSILFAILVVFEKREKDKRNAKEENKVNAKEEKEKEMNAKEEKEEEMSTKSEKVSGPQ
jgi:hypothetical protein